MAPMVVSRPDKDSKPLDENGRAERAVERDLEVCSARVSGLLLRVSPLRRIFSLGGHRNVEKPADHHHAEERVGKVLQHHFLPQHLLVVGT